MGVRMDADEVRSFLARGHTGILTTLGADGWAVPLPVWFVHLDGAVHVRTPAASHKVARVARDDRVTFLVEEGQRWEELRAVLVKGRARRVDDELTLASVEDALDAKYRDFRPDRDTLPGGTRRHYGRGSVVLRIDPIDEATSWDNRKIRRLPTERSDADPNDPDEERI